MTRIYRWHIFAISKALWLLEKMCGKINYFSTTSVCRNQRMNEMNNFTVSQVVLKYFFYNYSRLLIAENEERD
jgi:hypothetical protein